MRTSRAVTTLQDIARHSDVSVSTVSRVLNGHAHIAKATRTRVLQAIAELGYEPPRRSLSGSTSRTIALVTLRAPDITSAATEAGGGSGFNEHVRRGAEPVLEEAGLHPLTHHVDATLDRFTRYLDEARPSGTLFIGSEVDVNLLEALVERDHPFVIVGAHVDPFRYSSVMADVLHGTAAAVAHLVASGRRRIAVVNGPRGLGTHDERYEGWRLGLARGDLPYDAELERSTEFTAAAGFDATADLLAAAPDLDALLYGDDFMALGGLKALAEAGKRVPTDVSVIGFYDYPVAAFTHPSLTSVSVNIPRMGIIAAQLLLAQLDGRVNPPLSIRVPTALNVRGTCLAHASGERPAERMFTNRSREALRTEGKADDDQ